MCGIFGIVGRRKWERNKYQFLVKNLFQLSESRGKEAAGLAVLTDDMIDILKSPVSASRLLKSSAYDDLVQSLFAKGPSNNAGRIVATLGHSRLVTNGFEDLNRNNQPVYRGNVVCIHNGIIVNDRDLWRRYADLTRACDVDTEIIAALLNKFLVETDSLASATRKLYQQIEGSASIAALFTDNAKLLLATNTGSLYVSLSAARGLLVFTSEEYILKTFLRRLPGPDLRFDSESLRQLQPGTALAVDTTTLQIDEINIFRESRAKTAFSSSSRPPVKVTDHSGNEAGGAKAGVVVSRGSLRLSKESRQAMDKSWARLYSTEALRRCSRCILPATMPFIDFDEAGVCNYCRQYDRIRIRLRGEPELKDLASKFRRSDGRPDCIVPFSGGRDSTYGLHYIKTVLGLNPVAYTYDWGVLTDLGRRNQARICGKLGVEHIIISADIRVKRDNVRKNITAWLKNPQLGMIPLLMAGDKKLIYYAEWLRRTMAIDLLIFSAGGGYEDDAFKVGLTGVKMAPVSLFHLSMITRLKLINYYGRQFLRNPLYFNRSLFDSLFAFYYMFFFPHRRNVVRLYDYIQWDEDVVVSTIRREYNWESEPDTPATWRIDDGTAALYNYIYMTVAGFTEFDTFRSIQIREGQLDRARAYALIKEENKPRYESIEWYATTIGIDGNEVMRRINAMPKLYRAL